MKSAREAACAHASCSAAWNSNSVHSYECDRLTAAIEARDRVVAESATTGVGVLVGALEGIASGAIGCGQPCRHWGGDRPIGHEHRALAALTTYRASLPPGPSQTVDQRGERKP